MRLTYLQINMVEHKRTCDLVEYKQGPAIGHGCRVIDKEDAAEAAVDRHVAKEEAAVLRLSCVVQVHLGRKLVVVVEVLWY